MSQLRCRPVLLIVRDGWGANPHPEWNHANAVHLARKPVDDRLMATYPHVQIRTCGPDVGLPDAVMGNSEVGHQNIGAGRIVEQEIMRITGRIRDGAFFENHALRGAFDRAQKTGGNVHFLGLCSDGRVHSDLEHLYGLLDMSRRVAFPAERVYVHAITDGRDTAPDAGIKYVSEIEKRCKDIGANPVASVIGRYYAMDRDHRWDRVEKAYRLLAEGKGDRFPSATAALKHYYENPSEDSRHGDEFVTPSMMEKAGAEASRIRNGDSVVFFNFRGDRPRELTKAFVYEQFPYEGEGLDGRLMGFDRGPKLDLHFVTMTSFESGLPVHVAFEKPSKMKDILGEYISEHGLRQFRCAETEKYPHVTFFFNDYREEPFDGEEQFLVPSPRDVSTYDQKPQMSAPEVTDVMLRRIATGVDDLLVLNFANGDMVGHTGNLQAAIKAVETVDDGVGRVVDAVLKRGGAAIVTADHGNCEQMIDPATGGPHTAHTTYDVELIVVDEKLKGRTLRSGGRLADIAPTVLELFGLPQPQSMTGKSLILPRH
ncbi:MAG: 2,3-bisphosphoglycerate-independent phosphoglycerate mutase [Phycisphaerae bacterium]|nr:2,3-bisphosphoglycerate-independent phosphoglycerate mutase [Phycisphaerae bacterium]